MENDERNKTCKEQQNSPNGASIGNLAVGLIQISPLKVSSTTAKLSRVRMSKGPKKRRSSIFKSIRTCETKQGNGISDFSEESESIRGHVPICNSLKPVPRV